MTESGASLSAGARALRSKHAQELRDSWQGRLLAEAPGKLGAVSLVVLAHSYYEAMDVLMRVALPGVKVQPPCLTGTGYIDVSGKVICDMRSKAGLICPCIVFDSEAELVGEFRRLADRMKLSDADRRELFAAVSRWVSQDQRIKPSVEYSGRA